MKIMNWQKALETAKLDPERGIKIAPVTTDPIFRMFAIEILPGKLSVAQYHYDGAEIYLIMQGHGLLHTAMPTQDHSYCENIQSTKIVTGDCFNIYPGVAHQLENTGTEPLILLFSCPVTHLNLDKILVSDLKTQSFF